MMRKLWDALAIVAVANMLAIAILIAIFATTGKLSIDKLRLVRDVLADRPLPVATVTTSAPDDDADARLVTAGQMISQEQSDTKVLQLQIDQQMRELRDFQLQVDQARAQLNSRIAQFEQERSNWQVQREADRQLRVSEGFKKSLAIYESIPADQAKNLFMAMPDDEVVRFLSAMEERKAAKVVKAFESEAEKLRLKKILDLLHKPAEPAQADSTRPKAQDQLVRP